MLPTSIGTCRIAVADADPRVRATVRRVLEQMGAKVREADDGLALRRLLREEAPFALIVTDVDMPRCSGSVVLHELRVCRGDVTPAIVLSSRIDDARDAISGLAAVAVLGKPFSLDRFERMVTTAVVVGGGMMPAERGATASTASR